MSNRNMIKGMRRRAARRGLGRLHGNLGALLEAEAREQAKQDRIRKRAVQGASKQADALSREVASDEKRGSRKKSIRRRTT